MKKILLLIIFITTSCTQYTDLKDLSIIKSIGIDYHDSYTIYAQVYDVINKNNDPKTKIIKAYGKTIKEAFINLKNIPNKKLYYSHIDLLIFDTKLHDNNYNEIINYVINNNEFRNDYLVIVSNDIEKILNNSKYDEIENLIKTNNLILKKYFTDLINDFVNSKTFNISKIDYENNIIYIENYMFKNNKLERINKWKIKLK